VKAVPPAIFKSCVWQSLLLRTGSEGHEMAIASGLLLEATLDCERKFQAQALLAAQQVQTAASARDWRKSVDKRSGQVVGSPCCNFPKVQLFPKKGHF
jgi:hypothetical protein